MMHSIRALWLLPWLLMLAGCSIGGSRSLDVQPAPALDIEPATLAVTEDWSASVGAAAVPYHRLAISQRGGRVYVASADGQVSAIDHQNGESIWTQNLDAEISGGPNSTDTQVVVGTAGGEIVALDAEQGKLRWRASLSSEVLAPPAIGQEHVVARTGDGRVFALSNRDGAQQWLYSRSVPALSLRGHSAPVLVPDGVIAGFDHGRLSALDLQTGEPVWEATIAVPQGRTDLERMVDLDADPVVDRGDLFAGTYQGRLVGLSLSNGQIAWARDISVIGGIAVDDSNVYATDAEGQVWAVDRSNGASVWRLDALAGLSLSAPVRSAEHLVVGAGDGAVYWLDPADGEVLARYQAGKAPITATPVVIDNDLLVLNLRGQLKRLTLQSRAD